MKNLVGVSKHMISSSISGQKNAKKITPGLVLHAQKLKRSSHERQVASTVALFSFGWYVKSKNIINIL